MKPTIGRIIHCWPAKHDAPVVDGKELPLVCAAIVAGVTESELRVHYFLPGGENGACPLPLDPLPDGSPPERGAWWWPPRA